MKRCLLIDGNAMLFRAYYATLYGRMMTTTNGIPTNAVYGFITMINKALDLIKPDRLLVAFDSGKPTFRHKTFTEYKGTRKQLDQELIVQFPIAREYLEAKNIPWYECEGIEADDIIGSAAKTFPDYQTVILTSDRDLLQLIDATTTVLLMKKGITEMELVDEKALLENFHVTPSQIIELKGLMGDTADNIPGVKGVGEKTALKLLEQYGTVHNLYDHIDEIKGKLKEKLETNKDKAELSLFLATIVTDAKLPFDIESCVFDEDIEKSNNFYKKYEMTSFIQQVEDKTVYAETEIKKVSQISDALLKSGVLLYPDCNNEAYEDAQFFGLAFINDEACEYIEIEDLQKDEKAIAFLASNDSKAGFDVKHLMHLFAHVQIPVNGLDFDCWIAAFLNDGTITSYDAFAEKFKFDRKLLSDTVYGKKGRPQLSDELERIEYVKIQAHGCYSTIERLKKELADKELNELFYDIEMPVTKVLFEMENNGIYTDLNVLNEIAENTNKKIMELTSQIYEVAGHEFNINSPKQLGVVLFDELGLKAGKKRSTAVDVLEKLMDAHPIIPLLMEHRKYQKVYSTYAIGLAKHVKADGKIHTLFNQCLTTTGRLSSSEPNLQNISVRDEEGKEIRKAFVASPNHVLLSADYSQIELRMLAHMANVLEMIHAFNNGIDIHTQTAMSVFGVDHDAVTSNMRRQAKAVNFGIVYGISEFGLSEQLGISRNEAKDFIERYFASYPEIKQFMDETVAFCEEFGYVKTLFNRRREINEIHDKNYMVREFGKRAAMNAPIQGSSADLIKVAMVNVYKAMVKQQCKSKMILQIHDELIFDVCEDEIDLMKDLVKTAMEEAMELKVPLIADANIGKSWYDAK